MYETRITDRLMIVVIQAEEIENVIQTEVKIKCDV